MNTPLSRRIAWGISTKEWDLVSVTLSSATRVRSFPMGRESPVAIVLPRNRSLPQTYYGTAIRANVGNVHGAHNTVMAILSRSMSTDSKRQYEKCPNGEDSWYHYQRKKAAGATASYKHNDPLPEAIG